MSNTHVGGLTIRDYGQQVNHEEKRARKELEVRYGRVWDTQELGREFEVTGFAAPFVVAVRRADRARGSLEFTHSPRFLLQLRR